MIAPGRNARRLLAAGVVLSLAAAAVALLSEVPARPLGPVQPHDSVVQSRISSSPHSFVAPLPSSLEMRLPAIEAEPDRDRRGDMLQNAAESVSDAGLAAALELLANNQSPEASDLKLTLLRRLAEASPAEAEAELSAFSKNPDVFPEALLQVATAWGDTDPAAAAQWAAALPEGPDRTAAITSIAYEAARKSPGTAVDIAEKLPASDERKQLLGYALAQWAAADVAAALSWTQQLPPGPERDSLLAQVAVGSAEQAPSAAAALAAHIGPGEVQDRAAVAVVERWAQISPADAAQWVAQFPGTVAGKQAAQDLVALWAPRDGNATLAWLESLPQGPLREAGFAALAASPQSAD